MRTSFLTRDTKAQGKGDSLTLVFTIVSVVQICYPIADSRHRAGSFVNQLLGQCVIHLRI